MFDFQEVKYDFFMSEAALTLLSVNVKKEALEQLLFSLLCIMYIIIGYIE